MSKIEPFAEWLNENEDHSLEDLKQMRELGMLDGDGFDMYRTVVDKFMSDPEVNAAIDTLRKKFDLYTEALFPYDEYSDTWDEIRQQADDNAVGELGWFEYLMMG